MIRVVKSYLSNRYGGIVVEAALIMPLMLTAGLGAIDASYMMLQNHKLENQLSAAASYLSKSDSPELRENYAKQLAVTGSVSGGDVSVVNGWSVSDINITYLTTDNSDEIYRGDTNILTVQLTTRLNYSGMGILSSIMPNRPMLSASVQERVVGGGL